jgi:hypothetical protein
MKTMRRHHGFVMALVLGTTLLAIGCGDDGGGAVIDSAVPIDTAVGSPDGAPGGTDGAPGSIDAAPGNGDAGPLDDAGIGPDAAQGVDCNGQTCDQGTECCVTAGGSSCVEAGTCTGATIGCDGPEDCGDTEVCCGGLQTQCAAADTCQVELCHITADCQDPAQECCSFGGGTSSVCLDRCGVR